MFPRVMCIVTVMGIVMFSAAAYGGSGRDIPAGRPFQYLDSVLADIQEQIDGLGCCTHRYGGVAIVATSGGDYTNPVAAMSDLAVWCGTPSASNPCLVKILPGIYDIGGVSLQMQEYVDIEGSGQRVTVLSGNRNSDTAGVLNGASNAEVRLLTVRHTGGGAHSIAVYNNNASVGITHVTVASLTGSDINYGIYSTNASPAMTDVSVITGGINVCYGVYNINNSAPRMTQMDIRADCGIENYAVRNIDSSPLLVNVAAKAAIGDGSRAVWSSGSTVVMKNVTTSAYWVGVSSVSSSTVRIDHSDISGGIQTDSSSSAFVGGGRIVGGAIGSNTCAGVFDENYVFYANTCP